MLNQNVLPPPIPPGSQFQNVLVSEFNAAGNLVISDPSAPLILTAQDQADMVAYMKLLD